MFDITITGKIVLFVALPTTFVLLYLLLRRTDVRQRILRRWKLTTDKSVSSGQELTTDDEEEEEETTSKSRSSRQSVIELKVPTYAVSAVIGQGGTTIKKIEKNSRAKIEIKENEDRSEEEKTLLIKGHTKAVQKAELTIRSIIADVPIIISEDIYVPNSCTRFLLGKQAETLQRIRRVSGAEVVLDRVKINDPAYMRLVSLTGTREQNEHAKKLINEKIDEFETFQTTSDSVRLQESEIPLAEETLETTQMPPVREKWEIESEQGLPPLGNQRRDVLEVMVVAAENPGHFWGHICNENLTKLIQLQNELEAFYGKSEELEACRISEAAKNDIVAVCLDNGTKWFRARITEVLDDGYQVFCVDYGYREVVSKCDIRKLCGSFLSLPFQALECYLANIKPTDNENWSKSATEMFENMVCINQSKVISGDIINYQRTSHGLVPCLNLIDYNGPQVSWCNLWLRASPKHVPAKGTVNINEELVQMGHAEWDEASKSGRIFKDDLSADVSHKVLTREGSGSFESLNDPFLKFPLEEKHKIPSPPANAEWADDFPYAWAYNKEESTARGNVCEMETCLSDKYSPTREITPTGAGGINSLQETHTLPKETTESSYSMTGYDEENRASKTDDTKDLSGSLFYNGICSDVDRGLPASSDHPPICHPDGYSVKVPTTEDSTLCPFSTEDTYIDRREEILTSADDDTLFPSSQIDSKMSQVQDIDRLTDQQGRTLSNRSLDRSDTLNIASEQEDSKEFCSSLAVLAEPQVSTSKLTNISREDSSSAIVTLQDDHMTKLSSVEVPGREELALEESEYSVSISHDTSTSVQNREDDENELKGREGLHSNLGTKGDNDEGKGDAVVSRRDPNVLTDINANRSVENLEHEQALWSASLSYPAEHEQLLNKNMKASERSTNQLLPEAEATASGNAQISTTADLGISVTPVNVQSTRNQSEVNDRCVLGTTDDDSKTSDLTTDKIKIANELQTQTVSEISETESLKIDELSEITDTESCEKLKESGFLSVVPGSCLDETSSTLDYSQTEPLDILIPNMHSDISPAPCPTILDPTHTIPLPSVTTLDQPTLNVELTSSANLTTEVCTDLQEINVVDESNLRKNVHTQVAESEINVILSQVEEVLSPRSQRELSPEVFGWAVVTRTASETDSGRYQHVQSLPSIDKTLKDKWHMLYSPLEEDEDWKVRTELTIGQKTQCPVSKTQPSSESSETVSEPLEKDTHTDDIWKFYHTPVSDKERYSEDVGMMSEEAEYSKNANDAYRSWQTALDKSLSKDQNVFHEDWKHTLSEPLEDDEIDFYICSLSEYMTSERKDDLTLIEKQTEEKAGLPTMIYSSEKNIQVIESIKYVEEDGKVKEQSPVYSTNSTDGELHHDVTDLTEEMPKAEDSEKHVSTERPFWPKELYLPQSNMETQTESNIVPMLVTEENEKSDLEYSALEEDEWEEGGRTEKTLTEKSQDVKMSQDWRQTTSDPLEEETGDWLSFYSPVCEDSDIIDTESVPDIGVKQDPSQYSGLEEDEWQEGERPQIKYDKEMSSVKTFQKEWKETISDSLEEETDLLETSARTLVEPPTAPTTVECEKQPTDIEYATLEEDEWEEGENRKIKKDGEKPVEEKTFESNWKDTKSDPLEENDSCVPSLQEDLEIQLNGLNSTLSTVTVSEPLEHDLWTLSGHQPSVSDSVKTLAKTPFSDSLDEETNDVWPLVTSCYSDQDDNFDDVLDEEKSLVSKAVNTDDKDVWGMYFTSLDEANDEWNGYNEESCSRNASKTCKDVDRLEDFGWEIREQIAQSLPQQSKTASYQSQPKFFSNSLESWVSSGTGTLVTATPGDMSTPVFSDEDDDDDDNEYIDAEDTFQEVQHSSDPHDVSDKQNLFNGATLQESVTASLDHEALVRRQFIEEEISLLLSEIVAMATEESKCMEKRKLSEQDLKAESSKISQQITELIHGMVTSNEGVEKSNEEYNAPQISNVSARDINELATFTDIVPREVTFSDELQLTEHESDLKSCSLHVTQRMEEKLQNIATLYSNYAEEIPDTQLMLKLDTLYFIEKLGRDKQKPSPPENLPSLEATLSPGTDMAGPSTEAAASSESVDSCSRSSIPEIYQDTNEQLHDLSQVETTSKSPVSENDEIFANVLMVELPSAEELSVSGQISSFDASIHDCETRRFTSVLEVSLPEGPTNENRELTPSKIVPESKKMKLKKKRLSPGDRIVRRWRKKSPYRNYSNALFVNIPSFEESSNVEFWKKMSRTCVEPNSDLEDFQKDKKMVQHRISEAGFPIETQSELLLRIPPNDSNSSWKSKFRCSLHTFVSDYDQKHFHNVFVIPKQHEKYSTEINMDINRRILAESAEEKLENSEEMSESSAELACTPDMPACALSTSCISRNETVADSKPLIQEKTTIILQDQLKMNEKQPERKNSVVIDFATSDGSNEKMSYFTEDQIQSLLQKITQEASVSHYSKTAIFNDPYHFEDNYRYGVNGGHLGLMDPSGEIYYDAKSEPDKTMLSTYSEMLLSSNIISPETVEKVKEADYQVQAGSTDSEGYMTTEEKSESELQMTQTSERLAMDLSSLLSVDSAELSSELSKSYACDRPNSPEDQSISTSSSDSEGDYPASQHLILEFGSEKESRKSQASDQNDEPEIETVISEPSLTELEPRPETSFELTCSSAEPASTERKSTEQPVEVLVLEADSSKKSEETPSIQTTEIVDESQEIKLFKESVSQEKTIMEVNLFGEKHMVSSTDELKILVESHDLNIDDFSNIKLSPNSQLDCFSELSFGGASSVDLDELLHQKNLLPEVCATNESSSNQKDKQKELVSSCVDRKEEFSFIDLPKQIEKSVSEYCLQSRKSLTNGTCLPLPDGFPFGIGKPNIDDNEHQEANDEERSVKPEMVKTEPCLDLPVADDFKDKTEIPKTEDTTLAGTVGDDLPESKDNMKIETEISPSVKDEDESDGALFGALDKGKKKKKKKSKFFALDNEVLMSFRDATEVIRSEEEDTQVDDKAETSSGQVETSPRGYDDINFKSKESVAELKHILSRDNKQKTDSLFYHSAMKESEISEILALDIPECNILAANSISIDLKEMDKTEAQPGKNSLVDQTEISISDQEDLIESELESAQEIAEMKIKEVSALDEPEIEPCKNSQVDQTEDVLFDEDLTITPELESAQEKAEMKIKETSALDEPEIEPCKNSQVDQIEVALFDEDLTNTPELESAQEKAEVKIKETSALAELEIEPCRNSQVDQTEVALFDQALTITTDLELAQERAEININKGSALVEPEIEPCRENQVNQSECSLFDQDLIITPQIESAQDKAEINININKGSAFDELEVEPCRSSQVDQIEVSPFDQDVIVTPELESSEERAEMNINTGSAFDEPEVEPCRSSQVDQIEVSPFDQDVIVTPELESAQERAEVNISEGASLVEPKIEPSRNFQVDQIEVSAFDQALLVTSEFESAEQKRAEVNIYPGSVLAVSEVEPCENCQVSPIEVSLYDQALLVTSKLDSAAEETVEVSMNEGPVLSQIEAQTFQKSLVDEAEVADQNLFITYEFESPQEESLECKTEKQVLCEIENQVSAPVILSSNNLPSDIESNEGLALLSTQNQESQEMHATQTRMRSMKSCSWDSRHLPSDNVVKVESVYSQDDHMLFEQQTKAPQAEPIPLSSADESHQKKLTNQNELEKTVSNTNTTDPAQKAELSSISSDQHALLQKTDHTGALDAFQPAFASMAEKVTDEKLTRKKKKKKKSPFLYGNSEESIRSPHFREYVISDSDNEAGNKQSSIERDIDSQLQMTPEYAEVCLSETSKTAEVMTTDKNMTDVTTVDKDVTTVKTKDKGAAKMADIKPVGEKATAVTHVVDTPTFKDVTGVTTKDRDGSDVTTRYKDVTDVTSRDGDVIGITTIDKHVTDVTVRYEDVTKMGEATPVHKEMTDVTTTEVSLADVTHVYKDVTKVSGVISLEKDMTDVMPADNDIPEIVEHVTDLTTRYKAVTKVITKDEDVIDVTTKDEDVTDVTVDKDVSEVAGGTSAEGDTTKIVKEGQAEKSKRGKRDVKELPKKKESLKMEKTKGSRSSKSAEKEIFKERSSSLKAGDVKESVDAHVVESPRVSEKPNTGTMEFSVKDSKKKKKRKKSSIKETLNTVGDKLVPEDRQMTSSVSAPTLEDVVLEKCKEIPQTEKSSKMARATKEVAEGEITKAEECQSSFSFERTYPSVDRQVSSEEELQREFSLDPTDDKTDESIYNLLPSETEIDVRTDKESIQEELKGEFTTEEMPGTKAGDTAIDSSLQEKDQTLKEEEKQQETSVKKASISKTKKSTQETKTSVKTSNNLVEKSVPKKSETETRTLLGTKAKCLVSHSETSVASKIKFSANKTNLAEEKKKTDRLQRIMTQPPPVEVSVETSAFVEENKGEALLLSSSDEAAKKVSSFQEEATRHENESPKMKIKLTENKKKMRRSPFPYGDGNKSLLSKGIEEFFQSDDGILKTTDTEKSIPCPAKKTAKKTDTVPGSSHSTEAMHSEEVARKSFEDLVGNLSNKDYQTQTVTTKVSKEEFCRKSQERKEVISSVPSHCSHITEIDSKTEKEISPLNIKSGSSESIVNQALSKVSSLISKKSTSVSEDGSPKRKSTGSSNEENTYSSPPLSQKSDSSSSLNSGILTLSKKKQQKNVELASEKISVKASITDSQEAPVSFKSASSSGEDLSTKDISKEVSSSESVLGSTGKKEKLEVPKIAKNVVEKISSLVTSITKQVTESIEELSTHKKKLKQSSLSKNEANKKQESKQEVDKTQKQKLGSKEKTTKNASDLRNRSKGIFAGSQLLSIQQSSRKTSSPAVSRKKGQKQQPQSSSRRDRQNIPLGTITIESPRWEHTYLPLINHLTEEEAAFSDTTPQLRRKKKKKKRKERNLSQLSTATESSCEIDTVLLADSHRRSTQDLSVRKKTRATPPRITISENRTSKSDCWQSSTTNLTDEVRKEATPVQYLSSDNLSHTRSRSRSHRSPAKELLWLSEQDFLSDSHETDTSRRARSQSHINRFSKINLAYIPTGTRKRKRRKKNIIAV